jgi:hypothetical protein
MKKGKNHRTIFIVMIVLGVIVLASVLFYAISWSGISGHASSSTSLSSKTTKTIALTTTASKQTVKKTSATCLPLNGAEEPNIPGNIGDKWCVLHSVSKTCSEYQCERIPYFWIGGMFHWYYSAWDKVKGISVGWKCFANTDARNSNNPQQSGAGICLPALY